MAVGVAVEVSLAGESRPAGEDREGDDLACGKGGLGTGAALLGTVGLAKVIDDDVECGEEGVHVEHESVPFPTAGLGGKLTLRRGHLPLKSSAPNSHQAFKDTHGWRLPYALLRCSTPVLCPGDATEGHKASDRGYANFREPRYGEVRRISLPRTPVNRGMFGVLPCALRLSGTVHQGRVHFTYPRDAAQTFHQGEQLLFLAALAQDQLRVVLPSRRTRAHHDALQRHL